MAKRTIRVYRDGRVWVAIKDGASKASAIRNTQKEAYLAAKSIALNQGLSVTVYSPNGRDKKVINPKQKSDQGGCFITTACVKHYGLKDDCYELETLRTFRDNYLLKSNGDAKLVKQYYILAPALVQKLEADPNNKAFYQEIFTQITEACKAIEAHKYEKAKHIYCTAVESLSSYYKSK